MLDPCSYSFLLISGVETRRCSEGSFLGGGWNGFLLSKLRGENVPCRFCGGVDGDGHLFWGCAFSPLVHVGESPEFSSIVSLDKTGWSRLSGRTLGNLWADDAVRIAKNQLGTALGSYVDAHRHPFEGFHLGESDCDVADGPFVCSDGSLVVSCTRNVQVSV